MKDQVVRVGPWALALCATLAMPAQAQGVLDNLFGRKGGTDSRAEQARHWQIDEFTSVRVVPKETGAPDNQHPALVNDASLRAQLGTVETVLRRGAEPLFDPAELQALAPVIAKALAAARPDEDIQLVSTARRGGGALATPMAVTGRLFAQGGALQLIVHDARYDFVNAARMSRTAPRFTYGSRSDAGVDRLRTPAGSGQRADWVSFPMSNLTGPGVVGATTAPAPAAVAAPVAPAVTTPVAPAAPAVVAPTAPSGPADEIEQRLTTLKRLRDKGLITEEEYQAKRRELLQRL